VIIGPGAGETNHARQKRASPDEEDIPDCPDCRVQMNIEELLDEGKSY
jgi:hypothetical protein